MGMSSLVAQVGIGAGLLYGTESDIGLHVRGSYILDDKIAFNGTYLWLDSESGGVAGTEFETTLHGLDLEANYYLTEQIYALAGPSIQIFRGKINNLSSMNSESDTDTRLGFNIGGGYVYALSDFFDLYGELKYTLIKDSGQLALVVGVRHIF